MTIPAASAIWAHGRVGPYHLTRFNVQEANGGPGATVEAFADGLAVWSRPGSAVARSESDARDFLMLVVAAYTLRTGVALDFNFTGWVEARDATARLSDSPSHGAIGPTWIRHQGDQ